MNDWMRLFFQGDYSLLPPNWPAILLGLLLAFACGHIIAWVYMMTHSGLSYSRSFVNSLIVMPSIVSLVMSVLSNNLITAFGMAAGSQKFASAIIGCLLMSAAMIYLWYSSFGSRHRYDVIVNLHWARSIRELPDLRRTLDRHSWKAHLASQRSHEGYEGTDLSYRLLLRDANRVEDLLNEIRQVNGVSRVTSMMAEDESEL